MQEKKSLSESKSGSEKYRKAYNGIVIALGWLVRILWPFEVIGNTKLPEGGCVVCPNHISFVDILVLSAGLKGNYLRYMAKKELFSFKPFGAIISAFGAFPVDRKRGDVGAVKTTISIIKEGNAAVMFPQGHRNPGVDPKTTEVHGGAVLVARRAEAPIVPVYIKTKKRRMSLFRPVKIIVGDPVYPAELEEYGADHKSAMKALFLRACQMEETEKWS